MPATAQSKTKETQLDYELIYDPEDARYMAALKLMLEDVYLKKAPKYWDYQKNTWADWPFLGIAEFDVNGDGINEIFANPVEQVPEEDGQICPPKLGCPIFIFNINKKNKVRLLGVISTHAIAIDNSSYKGYRRLRTYQNNPDDVDPNFYDLYEYKKGLYQKLQPE